MAVEYLAKAGIDFTHFTSFEITSCLLDGCVSVSLSVGWGVSVSQGFFRFLILVVHLVPIPAQVADDERGN